MAPMKRRASSMKSAAKRSKVDTRVPTVVSALTTGAAETTLNDNLRSLLKNALPVALNAYKADRHSYENEVMAQAEKCLGDVLATLNQEQKAAMDAQTAVVGSSNQGKEERANRAKAKQDAEDAAENAKKALDAAKQALKDAEKTVEDRKTEQKKAKAAEKKEQSTLKSLTDKKDFAAGVLATEFASLRDGTVEKKAMKAAVAKVVKLGKECEGIGPTILSTLPLACGKPPAGRTEFEANVFTGLQEKIEAEVKSREAKVAAQEPLVTAEGEVVTRAAANVEQSLADHKSAEDALKAAQTANSEAKKAATQADHKLRAIWADMKKVCDAQDQKAAEVAAFQADVMGAFAELKEKEPEPEAVPEEEAAPAAEEAAPEEAAPEEAAPAAEPAAVADAE